MAQESAGRKESHSGGSRDDCKGSKIPAPSGLTQHSVWGPHPTGPLGAAPSTFAQVAARTHQVSDSVRLPVGLSGLGLMSRLLFPNCNWFLRGDLPLLLADQAS